MGVLDDKWREVGRAFAARPGATITLNDLREYCTGRIAHFKAPRSLVLVDSIPCNTTGKVAKNELRKTGRC
jgi:acyl-CoA synthetase (AMP-forming)/AMP-acid ligase II